MQTTFAIDDDLMSAAQALAAKRRTSVDDFVSSILRRALTPGKTEEYSSAGILLLPRVPHPRPVTLEHVNALRDASE